MHNKADSTYWVLKIGGIAAIIGSVLGLIGNLVHPPTNGQSEAGVAHIIAHAGLWMPIHMVIVAGLILMLLGLTALCRSISGGLAGALSWFAHSAVIAGVVIGVLLVTLDGLAAKQLADAWAAAPADEKATALRIVSAEETFNFAIASLFNILFAGVAYILLGLAVASSRVYKKWLGGIAVVAGIGSIVAGSIQAATGASTEVIYVLTIIFPTIITLWTAYMGILMYQHATIITVDIQEDYDKASA